MNIADITPGWWYLKTDYQPGYCIVNVLRVGFGPDEGKLWVFLADQEGPIEIEVFGEDQFIGKVPIPEKVLSDIELRLLDGFLDELGDYQSNAGSNDFSWPDYISADERTRILEEYHRWNGDYAEMVETFGTFEKYASKDHTFDFLVLDYLRNKLKADK